MHVICKYVICRFQDGLFSKYSKAYSDLKKAHEVQDEPDPRWIYVLRDYKEKWAFWLDKQGTFARLICNMYIICM